MIEPGMKLVPQPTEAWLIEAPAVPVLGPEQLSPLAKTIALAATGKDTESDALRAPAVDSEGRQ